jgi:hypothetical protein
VQAVRFQIHLGDVVVIDLGATQGKLRIVQIENSEASIRVKYCPIDTVTVEVIEVPRNVVRRNDFITDVFVPELVSVNRSCVRGHITQWTCIVGTH